MFEWIGDHWFQLLVLGGFVAIVLSLFEIASVIVNAINANSAEIVQTLVEMRNDLGEIERGLKKLEESQAFTTASVAALAMKHKQSVGFSWAHSSTTISPSIGRRAMKINARSLANFEFSADCSEVTLRFLQDMRI